MSQSQLHRRFGRPAPAPRGSGGKSTRGAVVERLDERVLLSASAANAAAAPPSAPAADARVYAPHATVRGQTLAQWSAQWWQWVFENPVADNALFDDTGAKACLGDVGKAFFLGGVFNTTGTAERTIKLPSGTPVFFPVLNTETDNVGVNPPRTVAEARAVNADIVATTTALHATIDGRPVPDLFSRREISAPYSMTLPEGNIFQEVFGLDFVGTTDDAVSDGFWVMTKPLTPGRHDINFGGTFGDPINFTLDVTYHIDVVPKGQYRKQPCPIAAPATAAHDVPDGMGAHKRAAEDVLS
jgi:hypothetical protein